MTRNGKIARLSREVREQLNRRLDDGEPGVALVDWLNSVPEVQAVLAAEFQSRSISEQNLSEWKAGGFCDWQSQQEALEMVRQLAGDADELRQATPDLLTDKLALWLAARYVVALKSVEGEPDWKRLRELCNDLVALRKGDHRQERLKLDRERLGQLERELALKKETKAEVGVKAILDEAGHNFAVREAVDLLREALKDAGSK